MRNRMLFHFLAVLAVAAAMSSRAQILAPALVASFADPVPTNNIGFGNAVTAVGTDRFIIGAWGARAGLSFGRGAAYLYNTNGTVLTITNPILARGEGFGTALAVVGT